MARRALNAYHDWYIGSTKLARMNTRPRAEGYPRTHIKRIGNWDGRPEIDQPDPLRPAGRRGTVPVGRTTREKDLTYELQQQAMSEDDLVASMAQLRAAFADPSSTGLLVAEPWPDHGTDIWGTFARAEDFDGDAQLIYAPTQYPGAWRMDPILVMRQLDGRWMWLNESGAFLTPMSWSSGGAGSVLVTNSGDAPAEPTVTVHGVNAGEDVHIGRDIAGGGSVSLWFRGMPDGTAGADLVVDFPNRAITLGGVALDDSHYDGKNSNWWDEYVDGIPGTPPGAAPTPVNVWHGPGSGTGIDVSFYSCGW